LAGLLSHEALTKPTVPQSFSTQSHVVENSQTQDFVQQATSGNAGMAGFSGTNKGGSIRLQFCDKEQGSPLFTTYLRTHGSFVSTH
jgi:hypothetical protein